MKQRHVMGLLVPIVVLGLVTAWGCGGGGGFRPDLDTSVDGEDADGGGDVLPDGDDVPTDTPGDTEDDDGGTGGGYTPFEAETSGGAVLTSANYRLEVFIAPVRPVGSTSSSNYNLELGPAGIRSR